MIPAPVGVQCRECVRAARSRVIPAGALLSWNRPYVSYGLIAVNVAAWMIGVALSLLGGRSSGIVSGGLLLALGGLSGPRVAAGEWWRIFTAGFLHSGLIHLGLNMAALFMFGAPLERTLGRLRFLTLYVTALAAGSLGALVVSPGALTVGASGAIFGLLGAIVVGQRASGISLRSSGVISLLVINLVFTVAVPGISIGGHLGGLAGGLLAGTVLFNRRPRRPHDLADVAACLLLAGLFFAASLWTAAHPLLRA